MHIIYHKNSPSVRAKLKDQIDSQRFFQKKYQNKVEEYKNLLADAEDSLSDITAVVNMMEEDLEELEATKEEE